MSPSSLSQSPQILHRIGVLKLIGLEQLSVNLSLSPCIRVSRATDYLTLASIGMNVASTSRNAIALAATSRRMLTSAATGSHVRPRLSATSISLPNPQRTFIRDSDSAWSASSASWTSSPSPSAPAQSYGAPPSQSPTPHPLPARVFSSSPQPSFSSHPPLSKRFSTTSSLHASHHFDTQAFAQRLEASGISREQADVLTESLRDVIDESISNLAKGLVTREEGDQTNYTQKVDFTRLKSELQLLERNDFALMKSENERLMADVEKLKQRLREEITRTTAGVRLDLNLEKGTFPLTHRRRRVS